ncbi:nucleoside hydrolase [Serinicoccus hydrothermalis]|uniref:nucleoside hydrolase n=1 Tax=Serinicoccus hydrothermalis TaxID=1758689 RepID=UPI000830FE1C|nr:nucleoside hydrolase [Serinicoccus hydrothermalis]
MAALIDPGMFTTEKADVRVEVAARWTTGMTVCNFEEQRGMRHFGGTAVEQVDFRPTVATGIDHARFCDLVVDSVERLTARLG